MATSRAFETEDLYSPEVIEDPYPYYGHLRETDPVHWNPEVQGWVVTRYEDVSWLIRNHEQFSMAAFRTDPRDKHPPIDEADWEAAEFVRRYSPFMIYDRPEHLAMRQAIHRWFTPKAVERWRASLDTRARELVAARLSDGGMEVKNDLAEPLPLVTICWMLGVPDVDGPRLRDLAARAIWGDRSGPHPSMRTKASAVRELAEYFAPLIDTRGRQPADDLISVLAEAERHGTFTREQCIGSLILLTHAGHETTLSLICNGTLAFARNPDQWDVLCRNSGEMSPLAVEESLRYDPPVKVSQRASVDECRISGKRIEAGDKLLWVIAAANRDPRAFSDPDSFVITRSPNHHLGFGAGIHHCIGAPLARIEAAAAFTALAERLPCPQLEDEGIEYVPRVFERVVEALHVSWR